MSWALWLVIGFVAGAAAAAIVALVKQQRLVGESARLQAELTAAQRAIADERAAAVRTQGQLRETFASLSKDALKDNRQDFLQNADAMLKPVRETLDKVQSQLAAVDKEREGSFREVASQLGSVARAQEELRRTTEGLSRSLRSPNVRGRWGEIQLKRIVELAGMLAQCDFAEKASVMTEQGARQTPDLIVRLPGDLNLVVDAKVPIDAYFDAVNAKDDARRASALALHARQVRDHIRSLGSKEYWRQFQPAPEFVVMFLPLEPLLSLAFEEDGTLLEQAASLRVIPATPMTLLAVLKAVAYGWRQQEIARNAEEIQLLGRDLYDRLATMVSHLDDVGANIKSAADSYDRLIGSLEQKVLPGARRFKELGVSSVKELEDLSPINLSLRRVRKEELRGPADDDVLEAEDAMPLLSGDKN